MNREVKDQFNKVQADFAKVHQEFDVVHQEFEVVYKELDLVHKELDVVHSELDVVHQEIDGLKTDIRHLHVLMEDFGGKLRAIAENFGTLELHRRRLVDHDERIMHLENTRPVVINP